MEAALVAAVSSLAKPGHPFWKALCLDAERCGDLFAEELPEIVFYLRASRPSAPPVELVLGREAYMKRRPEIRTTWQSGGDEMSLVHNEVLFGIRASPDVTAEGMVLFGTNALLDRCALFDYANHALTLGR
jgi:hypothetical protein